MTTQITEPTQPDADLVRRDSFMAALSLAEILISQTTKLPTSFDVRVAPWAQGEANLRFYFHHDVPGLRQFRDDQMLTERMEARKDGSVYCEATRDMDGVRVTAWTLTDPPKDDVVSDAPALALPQMAVDCPACGAEAGALCTSHNGTRVRKHDAHQQRRDAWISSSRDE
ncbi:zinc finger domain-containing protein [Streptomyces luteocolor]|uniref:zinc finger domain-containing protein n=1 Tax=Streptomyces luteocolor TaxID=285500 RepID=UPI00114D2A7D|nr:hypothetical protein [Streptomyces luteocolor]